MTRKQNSYKRLLIYLVPLGLLIVLATTRIYRGPLQWMASLAGNLVYAAQDRTYAVVTRVRDIFARYFFLVGLHDENKILRGEVDRLYGEVHRLQEDEAQVRRLQRLLRFTRSSSHKWIAAEVIGRESGSAVATVIINKGTAEGVQLNAGVIVPRGVVGKVMTAATHHAQVLLMTDPRSAIAAIVQKTREEGMVHGVGQGKIHLKYLTPLAKAAPGDHLITSGLEGSFPKGIRLGRIETTEVPKDDFFLRIIVIPEVSLPNVEEVLVSVPPEQESPFPSPGPLQTMP